LAHDACVLTLIAAAGWSGVDVDVEVEVEVDVDGELELLELLELLDDGGTDDELLGVELELDELLELELLDDGGTDDELLGVELELDELELDELLGLLELTATDDDVAVAPSRSVAPTGPASTPRPAKAMPSPAITPPTLVTRSMATSRPQTARLAPPRYCVTVLVSAASRPKPKPPYFSFLSHVVRP
jgi:hypothetical protein